MENTKCFTVHPNIICKTNKFYIRIYFIRWQQADIEDTKTKKFKRISLNKDRKYLKTHNCMWIQDSVKSTFSWYIFFGFISRLKFLRRCLLSKNVWRIILKRISKIYVVTKICIFFFFFAGTCSCNTSE